jgi:hypothetical protein
MSGTTGKLEYVSLPNMHHLLEGLTFKVTHCAEVLDCALIGFNKKTGIPNRILRWNKRGGNAHGPLSLPGHGRIIVEIAERLDRDGQRLSTSLILEKKDENEKAPIALFMMQSPVLNVPMRVEVPLRALIKGAPKLKGTYSSRLGHHGPERGRARPHL